MSFTLRIKNASSGADQWWADYSEGWTYSYWLAINETWNCPYGAYGATDLHIWVVDSNFNTLHNKTGLGPIYDDKAYLYDCSTGVLSEGEEVGRWKLLDTKIITLTPSTEEVGRWKLLDTKIITLTPSTEEVGRWKLLDTKIITLTPTGVPPPPPPPPPPPDGKEIPWEWIAAGGLGIGAAVLLIPKKKKSEKKPVAKLPQKKKLKAKA